MTYSQAMRQCEKVGCAHATGEALAAMYAKTIPSLHGGKPAKYFAHLSRFLTDAEITKAARRLLGSREAAWDVLME